LFFYKTISFGEGVMKRKCQKTGNRVRAAAVVLALLICCSWAGPVSAAEQVLNYTFDDTVAYNWIDISATGTNLGLSDEGNAQIALPFAFNFYGTPYNAVTVSANGALSFYDTSISYANSCLPTSTQTTLIAPFWDDLNPGAGGAVHWEVQGSAPNRQVIVQWSGVPHYTAGGAVTFQAILSEGSNQILLQYQDVDFGNAAYNNGASATVGLQGDSASVTQYSCNTPALAAATAILFEPPDYYLTLSSVTAGCGDETKSFSGMLNNQSGSGQTFAIGSKILAGKGYIYGPSTLTVPDGGTGNFTVKVRPSTDSAPILASVTASLGADQVIREISIDALTGYWTGETDSPQGARNPAVAAHGNYLYQIGGENPNSVAIIAVHRYDTVAKAWTARADLPTALTGINAATIGNKIYVPGGSSGATYFDALHIYDSATNTWSVGTPLPVKLAWASVVTDQQKLYVIGGRHEDGSYSNKVYIYNPSLASWSTGADMVLGRRYASAAYIGGKIYVAGGLTAGGATLDAEVYTIAANSWSAAPSLPDGMGNGGWAPYNGGVFDGRYFVVIGGDVDTTACAQIAVMYDTRDGHWEGMAPPNRCIYGTKGAGIGNVYYRLGGRTNEGGWHFDTSTEYYFLCKGFPWPMFRAATSDLGGQ
jgi:N-acetylneuraminic acid mutarotase